MAKKATKSVSVSKSSTTESVASVLESLVASLPAITPMVKGKAPNWKIHLDEEAQEVFTRWISAKIVAEPVMQRLENSKDILNEICLQEFCTKYFESRSRPSNPQLETEKNNTVDHTASWLFTDKFKVKLPEVTEGLDAKSVYISAFTDSGLHPHDAESLVNNELILNPVIGVRPITDLLTGHYGSGREFVPATEIEKSAGKKLAMFLTASGKTTIEGLTDDEKIALIHRDSGVTLRDGFLERVCAYAKSVDQLIAIFNLIKPVSYPAYPKFAVGDNPVEQSNRKIAAAADILGTNAD